MAKQYKNYDEDFKKTIVNLYESGKVFEKYNSIKEVTREIINEFIEKIIIVDIIQI